MATSSVLVTFSQLYITPKIHLTWLVYDECLVNIELHCEVHCSPIFIGLAHRTGNVNFFDYFY